MLSLVVFALLVAASWGAPAQVEEVEQKPFDFEQFIKGGVTVNPVGKWPSICSIQVNGRHGCGCTLISTSYILTAAHCLTTYPQAIQIVLGMHDMAGMQGKPQRIQVASYKRHEYFSDMYVVQYDVAVARLSKAAQLNQYVQISTLADTNAGSFVGSTCYIAGWGVTNWGGLASVLQEALVDVYSNTQCSSMISPINSGHICVLKYGASGACNGDSGGPLYCNVGGSWIQAGLTSWGRNNCPLTSPSVYTRVSAYRNWIRNASGV